MSVRELHLLRTELAPTYTLGVLSIDGAFECYTLEDRVHAGPKVPGATAIPAGRYEVTMRWSNRFGMELPRLENVPGFAGILIHAGNTEKDTAGCILVGQEHEDDHLLRSRRALDALLEKLTAEETPGMWLIITGPEADQPHKEAL